MRFLCLVGWRRTGSNRICLLLSRCESLNVKYELFHRTWVEKLTPAERAALDGVGGQTLTDDDSICRWRSQNPASALEAYKAGRPEKILVFKVFPEHLSRDAFRSEIIARPDIGFLALRRRPIESYISDVKAEIVQSYVARNTTEVKPSLDAAHFGIWAESIRGWDEWAKREIRAAGRPLVELSWDADFAEADDEDAIETLQTALQELGLPRSSVTPAKYQMRRQEREADFRNRVANWREFEVKACADPESADLLAWAAAAPRSEARPKPAEATRIAETALSDDELERAVARLAESATPLDAVVAGGEHLEEFDVFRFLRGVWEKGPEPRRAALSMAVEAVEDRLGPGRLGPAFLDLAYARSLVSNADNWANVGFNCPAPTPPLLAALQSRATLTRTRPSPLGPIHDGILRHIEGDDAAAFEAFAACAADPRFLGFARDDLSGAMTCRPFPTLASLVDVRSPFRRKALADTFPERVGALKWLAPPVVDKTRPVVSFGCDDRYFRIFSAGVLNSLPTDSSGLAVHFHVVNLSGEGRRHSQTLRRLAEQRKVNLLLSWEKAEVRDRAYFACARFLRLPELLAQFDAPILLLDIDCELKGDPREWIGGFPADCVSLLFKQWLSGGGYLPWRRVWAGMVFAPPTRAGRIFAKTLQGAISYLWSCGASDRWWIDQNALYVACRLMQRNWGWAGIHSIEGDRFHDRILTSAQMKIDKLRADPEVAATMAGGLDWERAMKKLQLAPPA